MIRRRRKLNLYKKDVKLRTAEVRISLLGRQSQGNALAKEQEMESRKQLSLRLPDEASFWTDFLPATQGGSPA